MAALTEAEKLFIVQALACFDTPTQVADAVKEEFGTIVTRMQVANYDPTKPAGAKVSKKLAEIFHATRKAFLENVSQIPIASQSYRMRVLQRTLNTVERQGNTAMVATVLEQAAKEVGGAFTNRRELTGAGGKPIETRSMTALSDAELLAIATGGGQGTPGA